jgi:hypothetical protein
LRQIKIIGPPLIWALLIAVLCGMPGHDIPHISFLELLSFDKFVHASLFFVLVLLMVKAFKQTNNYKNAVIISLCLAIPYGGILEILQQEIFVDRSADLYDFVANSFGCFMAWSYISLKKSKKEAKRLANISKNKS